MPEPYLYAWHDFKKDIYRMVYNHKKLVEMCSPDHFRRATKEGEGKIVKLHIIEVEEEE